MIYGYTLWIGHLDFYDTPAKISVFSSSVPDESATDKCPPGWLLCVVGVWRGGVFGWSGEVPRRPPMAEKDETPNCCDFPRVVRGWFQGELILNLLVPTTYIFNYFLKMWFLRILLSNIGGHWRLWWYVEQTHFLWRSPVQLPCSFERFLFATKMKTGRIQSRIQHVSCRILHKPMKYIQVMIKWCICFLAFSIDPPALRSFKISCFAPPEMLARSGRRDSAKSQANMTLWMMRISSERKLIFKSRK